MTTEKKPTSSKTSRWTDEMIEDLKKMYLVEKLTTVAIAKKLDMTKNAVIGKIHRLNLQRNTDDETVSESNSAASKMKETVLMGAHISKKVNKPGEYSLEDIEHDMCVWPYGEAGKYTFCGKKVCESNRQYCEEHNEEMYLKPKKSKKETDKEDIVEDTV